MKNLLLILCLLLFSCQQKINYKFEENTTVLFNNKEVIITLRGKTENGILYRVKLLDCKSLDNQSCLFVVKESELKNK